MIPLNANRLKTLYAQALSLQSKGQTDQALALYKQINAANPKIAEVYYQVGRIQLSKHQYASALDALKKAQALKPKEPAIWSLLVEATLMLGDAKETKTVRKDLRAAGLSTELFQRLDAQLTNTKAKTKGTVTPEVKAKFDTLVAMMQRGDFTNAAKQAAAAAIAHPDQAMFPLIGASAHAALGNDADAVNGFEAALQINPDYAEAANNFGRFYLDRNQPEAALPHLQKARKLAPKMASAMSNLGAVLVQLKKFNEAETILKQAARTDKSDPEILYRLGTAFAHQSQHDQASKYFRQAIKKGFKSPAVHVDLGISLVEQGAFDAARAEYKKALEISPKYAKAEFRLGTLSQTEGNFEAAKDHFLRAIEYDPKNGEFFFSYTASNKLTADDPLIPQMKAVFEDESLPLRSRRTAGFALAKVMEDTGAFDQVFTYLRPANDLMKQEYPYDIAERRTHIDRLKSAFEGFDVASAAKDGLTDAAPIFVTGMPRSGTTLVEQIIASHSHVEGAGEVGFAANAAHETLFGNLNKEHMAGTIAPKHIRALGASIAEHLGNLFPGAKHVSDKSIQTYTVLPLIKAALPNARIIVVRRDPRDNLLSIYKNMFVDGTHNYAYDLTDLGLYYKMFEELIDHWRDGFGDCFSEIHYEDLIADPETQARQLIANAGLEWQDACLNFHQNKRDVKTLSVYQVRQPIYKSSLKAWQRYEKDLEPLFEALK